MRAAALGCLLLAAPAAADVVRVHGMTRAELARWSSELDFWGLDRERNAAVFHVDREQRKALEAAGLRVETDVERQRRLDRWRNDARTQRGADGTLPGLPCYRTVDRTHADLQALAAAHPDRAQWLEIGRSWQADAGSAPGDTVHALVIGSQESPYPQAPLVVAAAQHARELAPAEIATRFAEWLLANPADDPDVEWLLDHRTVHIVAQANPDGRRRVEQGVALWRKNDDETACPSGNLSTTWPGVDLNRNGSFLWAPDASPCSQVHAGPSLASEPETRALETYMAGVFPRQRPAADLVTPAPDDAEGVFVSLHSFGEYVLIPWEGLGGQNDNNAPDHDALTLLGRRFGDVTGYAVARWSLLPPATGTAVDYAYGEFGVAAYTFEVGTDFAQTCASFESTVWPDNREALMIAARAARRPYLAPSGPALDGLSAAYEDSRWVIRGQADDGRYFSGGVTEPPQPEPIGDVVEIRVSGALPPELAPNVHAFPVAAPATAVNFELAWPPGTPLPANRRVFVVAVDDAGQAGPPRMVRLGDLIHGNGFESPGE